MKSNSSDHNQYNDDKQTHRHVFCLCSSFVSYGKSCSCCCLCTHSALLCVDCQCKRCGVPGTTRDNKTTRQRHDDDDCDNPPAAASTLLTAVTNTHDMALSYFTASRNQHGRKLFVIEDQGVGRDGIHTPHNKQIRPPSVGTSFITYM